ncbi:MAG: hypothetical protein IPN17_04825 [Deltaproteobacteria bacterium]|nr:hypothetical protein [Deltaproteobacteria bacterium]
MIAALEACTPLDAFADAIQEEDDAEVLDGLIALEGLIAAATALGASELAERLVEETAVRATCVGPNLLGLASFAEARAHSTTAVLARYWREVGAGDRRQRHPAPLRRCGATASCSRFLPRGSARSWRRSGRRSPS